MSGRGAPSLPSLPMALALALALLAGPAGAAPLGRLFATPAERAALDAKRGGGAGADAAAQAAAAAAAAAAPPPPPPPPPPTRLDGVVQRSGGKSTVWLNQVPQNEPYNQFGPDPAAAALRLQLSTGQTVILKPGQRFDPADGSVRESGGR